MIPSTSVIILSEEDRLQRCLRKMIEEIEIVLSFTISKSLEESPNTQITGKPALYLADVNLLPPPAQVTQWLIIHPQARLLILRPKADENEVLGYLQAGAMGHLAFEEIERQRVTAAICPMVNNEAFLSPSIAGRIIDEIVRRHQKLDIEKEVKD